MVNESNVDELLRRANPVIDPEQLRLTAAEVDARCASILEESEVTQARPPIEFPPERPPSAQWRPALAAAATALLVLVVVGALVLFVSGGDPDIANEPAETTAAVPSTTMEPTPPTVTTLPAETLRDLEERLGETGHVGLAFLEPIELRLGDAAPGFTAQIIGGGLFDLGAPRERPLLIGLFATTEGWFDDPGSLENEAVVVLEWAYWQYGDRVDAVAVVTGQTSAEVEASLPAGHNLSFPIAVTEPSVAEPALWSVTDSIAFVLLDADHGVLGGFGSDLVAEIGPGRGAYNEFIGILIEEIPRPVETTDATPEGYDAGILGRLDIDVPWRVWEWQILGVDVPAAEAEGVEFLAIARIGKYGDLPADTRIWVSPNTETWAAVDLPDTVVTGNRGPFTGPGKVAPGGPGLVAVGVDVYEQDCFKHATLRPTPSGVDSDLTACDGSTPRGSAVWTSPDGLTWSRVAQQTAFDGAYMYSVAAGDGMLVAVGFEHRAGSQNCDCLEGRSVVWTSHDGVAWTRLAPDEEVFGQSVMYDVAYGPTGFLAVGWKTNPDWDDPVFWHSLDGLDWNRVAPPIGSRAPYFVGVKDSQYVVATGGGGLYWSPDGMTWAITD